MKKTYFSIFLILFYSCLVTGMDKKSIQFICCNNETSEDGPTIPFHTAPSIQSLKTMFDDITIPETEAVIPFYLHNCDLSTANHLSTCLTYHHEKKDDTLTSYIAALETDEIIKLTNLTNTINAPCLEQPCLTSLCKKVNYKTDPILKALNSDIQKKLPHYSLDLINMTHIL